MYIQASEIVEMISSDTSDIQNTRGRDRLLQVCLERKIPFASYRMPNESNVVSLLQYTSAPRPIGYSRDLACSKGFVIAPFVDSAQFPAMLLEPDYIHTDVDFVEAILATLSACDRFVDASADAETLYQSTLAEFTEQVEEIRTKIREGIISKAVLSRIHVDTSVAGIDLVDLFNALCQAYPAAFVYFLQMPGVGCWMGASPEPLLLVNENRAKTASIAGTQVLGDRPISLVEWKDKELHEQAIVTGYIEEVLKSFGVADVTKSGPASYQAANLIHLRTQFDFDATAILPKLGLFVDSLQPTPSICGLPKKDAKKVVLDVEKHSREYYSGFLGPVNIDDKSSLFVNLRCMKVVPQGFAFFVGAGITEGSVPGHEWEETAHKMLTLLSVVNSVKLTSKAYGFSKTGN